MKDIPHRSNDDFRPTRPKQTEESLTTLGDQQDNTKRTIKKGHKPVTLQELSSKNPLIPQINLNKKNQHKKKKRTTIACDENPHHKTTTYRRNQKKDLVFKRQTEAEKPNRGIWVLCTSDLTVLQFASQEPYKMDDSNNLRHPYIHPRRNPHFEIFARNIPLSWWRRIEAKREHQSN